MVVSERLDVDRRNARERVMEVQRRADSASIVDIHPRLSVGIASDFRRARVSVEK